MTRKLNTVLLCLLVLVGGPFAWFLLDASTDGRAAHPVTIAQLRALAGAMPGDPPVTVHFETIGRREVIGDLLAAGSGLRPVTFLIRAFQLVMANGESIVIDRGMSREVAQNHRVADFDPRAQAMVDRTVDKAMLTLVLAPEVHHSGLATVPPAFGSGAPSLQVTVRTGPYPVASGVVVIPVYGIAPGERMIYVRLAGGRELLWTGDVAPTANAWHQMRPPARLVTSYYAVRDRNEIAAWLRTLRALKREAPDLQIVAGHDAGLPGWLVQGFAQ